jgi:predicted phosphodiesterase
LSDIHLDYEVNSRWLSRLSRSEYTDDLLILAGDISDSLDRLKHCFVELACRFRYVSYVPGNHDLWVVRNKELVSSIEKYELICSIAESFGVSTRTMRYRDLTIVPLLGWYDYSFGQPCDYLIKTWMDYHACRWPKGFDDAKITRYFTEKNEFATYNDCGTVISFSHFLPRIDLMPSFIPMSQRRLYPVLGCTRLEEQIRHLDSTIHVYGHSHVNRQVCIDGILYVNNAFGYPSEARITAKELVCIFSN